MATRPFHKISVLNDNTTRAEEFTQPPPNTYVDPKSLVGNQLNTLLRQESPYIKQARVGALEQANRSGMAGSTMAAGAGQGAAIKSALEIAKPDALTYGQSALESQKSFLAGEEKKLGTRLQGALNTQTAGYDFQNTRLQGDLNFREAQLNADTVLRQQFSGDLRQALQNYGDAVIRIQTDPNLSSADKTRVLEGLDITYESGTREIARALGFNRVRTNWNYSTTPSSSNTPVTPQVPFSQVINGTNVTFTPQGSNFIGSNGITYILTNNPSAILNPNRVTINGKQYVPQVTQ